MRLCHNKNKYTKELKPLFLGWYFCRIKRKQHSRGHNGPKGWVLSLSNCFFYGVGDISQFLLNQSWQHFSLKISTKLQNLQQTSASKYYQQFRFRISTKHCLEFGLCFRFKIMTKIQPLRLCQTSKAWPNFSSKHWLLSFNLTNITQLRSATCNKYSVLISQGQII